MENKFLEMQKILPSYSYTNSPLILEEKENRLLLYYESRYTNGKLKSENFQPKKSLVPKKLKISREIVEMIGLYQGDGQKSIKSKSYQATRFANSEPELIKRFLEFLKLFDIKLEELKVYVRVRTKLKKEFTDEEIITYWHEITGIPRENFYKVKWVDVKGDRYYKKGTITVIYANSSFRIIFDSLFHFIKKMCLINKNFSGFFIAGLIAADGSVHYHEFNRAVNIAAKYKKDRDYAKQLLTYLGIISNKDCILKGKEAISITGYPNFEIINTHQICNIHPEKKIKFKRLFSSYKNKCYRKNTCIPLIINILKANSITVKDLALKLGRKQNAVRRYLYMLEKQNIVKRDAATKRENIFGRLGEKWSLF